jgi:hypothetical protein
MDSRYVSLVEKVYRYTPSAQHDTTAVYKSEIPHVLIVLHVVLGLSLFLSSGGVQCRETLEILCPSHLIRLLCLPNNV